MAVREGDIVGKEFEAYMIQYKLGGIKRDKMRSESPLRRLYRSIPAPIRGIGLLNNFKKAYTKRYDAMTGEMGFRLFAMSLANYLLNSDKGLVERHLRLFSDAESKNNIKKIIRAYSMLAFSGNFTPQPPLYGRELHSKITREGSAYRYGDFLLPANSFLPEVFVSHHGMKELPGDVLARIRNTDFLDFGASIGDSALVLSGYTEGKIYSFEPDPAAFSKLTKTIDMNGLGQKVVPVNLGVGATSGKLGFDGFPRDAYFHHEQQRILSSETVSADDFLEGKNANIGLIKMDIEGFELEALKGAEGAIKKFKPVVLAAVYHTGKDFFKIPEYLSALNKEYRFKLRLLNEEYPTKEPVLIAY